MNSENSRIQAVISIYYIQQKNSNKISKMKTSVFHIIDLEGTEGEDKSNVIRERTKESCSINKSLLNSRDIINNKKQIPYRDSKLTILLRDSLCENAKTLIISTITTFPFNLSETKFTYKFSKNEKN